MMREDGFYWVKAPWGEWIIAEWDSTFEWWAICGDDRPKDDTAFDAIGPKVEPPEDLT